MLSGCRHSVALILCFLFLLQYNLTVIQFFTVFFIFSGFIRGELFMIEYVMV